MTEHIATATHPAHWIPYRGYWIECDPPPIPSRAHDWQWWHDDYDGAEDAHDRRHGASASLEEAKAEIDAQIEEAEEAEEAEETSDLRHDIEDAKRDWDYVTRLDDYAS